MAVRRKDLDELNRPPRPVRALPSLPLAAGAENFTGNEDAEMAEPTVGEILVAEMRDIKKLLGDAMTEQTRMRVQVDMHETDLRDLKTWRDNLPEKKREQQQQQQAAWWQTTNGRINIALAVLVIVTTVAPYIHLSIGK